MRKRKNGETTPDSKEEYEQSYGDAQAGGWAPRRRAEDVDERSRYSSQRDRQEDRSGFRRGWQGQEETSEQHQWGKKHARGDEEDEDAAGETGASQPAATESTAWVERRRRATRRRGKRLAKRKRVAKAKRKRATAGKRAVTRPGARKTQKNRTQKVRRKARKRRGE